MAQGQGPRPLIIVFHGFTETARWIDRYTALPSAGADAGFAVASPFGYDQRWNFPRRRSIGPDDVQFVREMVRAVAERVCLDRNHVFVTGFSDGADMAATVVRGVNDAKARCSVHDLVGAGLKRPGQFQVRGTKSG